MYPSIRFLRVPTHMEIVWPALIALRETGMSATISEHVTKFIEIFEVPERVTAQPHGASGRSELEYRLAWARTGLKRAGFLENSGRGVWSVTETGAIANETTVKAAIVAQRKLDAEGRIVRVANDANEDGIEDEDWQDRLLRVLKSISPDAFERLAKRLLRESGFTKVEVTGRSGDQGIDGTGILQLNLISFPVLFQCKRYEGSVGPGAIRDFRGAMMGRSDKGLFITTGSFTAEAKKEGTRDGAPSIELIDGPLLCDLLKKLGLGVVIRMVEVVEPDGEWFKQL
jgi:restriction system protein